MKFIKTRAEILEECVKEIDFHIMKDKTVAYPLITDNAGLKFIMEEFIGVKNLKKQMSTAVDNAVNEFMNDYPKANTKIVFNLQSYIEVKLRELCNSSEQIESAKAESVFGEHNTGEATLTATQCSKKEMSSPVQNPVCDFCGRIEKVHSPAMQHKFSPVQKKCTCPKPKIPKFVYAKDNYRVICGRCGGAL